MWAQTCVNGEKTSTDAQMSAVHGGYISVTQKSGQVSIVHVNARWNSRTTYMAQPIACWHYLPAGITCLLALLACWHCMPAGTTCPLALLARWRYMPASTMCPLALLARWHYLPAGATCPLATRAR